MSDREWLLSAQAIKAARICIKIVNDQLGVRLTLSHPDFLDLLNEYSELTDSADLMAAVKVLSNYAGVSERQVTRRSVVTSLALKEKPIILTEAVSATHNANEMISYNGKSYRRFQQGKEFKGLYRGQPRYG